MQQNFYTKTNSGQIDKIHQSQDIDLIRKTIELTETKALLKDKLFELKALNKEINKQNRQLIRRTIDLTEIRARLEDKNIDLININKELEKKSKELIRRTLELTDTKAKLEDRNLELAEANKEILSMLKVKTEFINQAAHDLRTPLTPILTLIPIVRKKLIDKESLHIIEIIENNANYLNHIVSELLNLVRTQTSRLEYVFEYIDIRKLIEEILSNNDVILKGHSIKVIKKFDRRLPNVNIDKFKIIELLQNILSNAVKFTPGGGTITVIAKKIDNFINVRMNDTGIGMSKATIKKLFTEFFKADTSRHAEGIGLGLSICKRIIEKHHGMIWAESRGIGKGSTIIFEIPIRQSM